MSKQNTKKTWYIYIAILYYDNNIHLIIYFLHWQYNFKLQHTAVPETKQKNNEQKAVVSCPSYIFFWPLTLTFLTPQHLDFYAGTLLCLAFILLACP